jgi:hypothetical protein
MTETQNTTAKHTEALSLKSVAHSERVASPVVFVLFLHADWVSNL